MKYDKEDFLNYVKALLKDKLISGKEWQVNSTDAGCKTGYSKVYLRRKRGRSGGHTSKCCFPDEEAKKIKSQIRELLRR